MDLKISFSNRSKKLTVTLKSPGAHQETILMTAHSGGWDNYDPLPKGSWLIVENPSGNRGYFGLFYKDDNINDQFRHNGRWRDGIRFGFHNIVGSHGCIMTMPSPGESFDSAGKNWSKIQTLVRTKRPRKIVKYQNNENPRTRDGAVYHISSYGYLTVTD